MEYIRKQNLAETFEKLRDARKKKMNCNRQSAIEYQVFDYVCRIIETMETENLEPTDHNV